MELKAVTTKTGFANTRIPDVKKVYETNKSKTATEKWKENLYFEEKEKLTNEEISVISEELENKKREVVEPTPQELYEREISKYNPVRDELLGRTK